MTHFGVRPLHQVPQFNRATRRSIPCPSERTLPLEIQYLFVPNTVFYPLIGGPRIGIMLAIIKDLPTAVKFVNLTKNISSFFLTPPRLGGEGFVVSSAERDG